MDSSKVSVNRKPSADWFDILFDAPSLLTEGSREVRALDANLAPGEVITMREQVDRMSWSYRAAVILLTTCSVRANWACASR